MEGWKDMQFGSLGNNYSGISGKTKDDFGKGVSYIPYVNVFNNSKISIDKLDLVDIRPNEKQNKVRYGDILFTTSSETIREVGMTSVMLDNLDEVYLNSFCFGFRLYNFDTLSPEYARYLLRSEKLRHKISLHGKGSTRFNISKGSLFKELYIHIPESTDEQRKIAEILSSVDRAIEQTEQLIAKYRSIKQGLMHDLLTYGIDSDGNIRNPKTHKFETKNGILVPSEWDVENIGAVANTYAGGTPSTDNKDYYNGNIPWITSSEVNLDSISEPSNYISDLGLKFSNAKWIPKNNVLIAMYGATAGQVSFLNIDATANQAVLAVIAKINIDQYYLYYQLNFNRERLLYLAQGSGQINLNKKLIDSLYIGKPKYEEQQEISKRLRSQDILIEKEKENLTKYKKIKQGLMHDLLTPTKRVKL